MSNLIKKELMSKLIDINMAIDAICNEWCGCLGIIEEAKEGLVNNKYLIGIPMPGRGTAYIFDDGSNIEYIGLAIMIKEEGPA